MSHHHHHPDLQDVALGYLIGRSAGQRPPNNSDGGGGGVWILVIAAVLVGLADLGMVPALWTGAGGLMRDAPVLGLVCYLFAIIAAAFPPLVAWGMVAAAISDRQFAAQWREQQEENRIRIETISREAQARQEPFLRAKRQQEERQEKWKRDFQANTEAMHRITTGEEDDPETVDALLAERRALVADLQSWQQAKPIYEGEEVGD